MFKRLAVAPLTNANVENTKLEDSYWILIRAGGRSVLGVRIDNTLNLSPNLSNGHKHNNKNYALVNDDVFQDIQGLFE